MKKVAFIMFCIITALSFTASITAFSETADGRALVCDENGDFTILIVSDPQCDNENQWRQAGAELETLVQRANPDFVLINGDMNSNNIIPDDMWSIFISPLEKRKIYWSVTNGNHDPFKYEYYRMYENYKHCLNSTVGAADADYDFTRPMNYVLPVFSNDGKKIVFAVYGMDSGQSGADGYEGVTQKQINWYIRQSNKLKEKNNGIKVTSLVCMHIPLPQTLDMYYSATDTPKISGKNSGGLYTVYGVANEPKVNKNGYVCENGTEVSKIKIHTTAKKYDRGFFDAVLNQGDVKAIIFGHDHCTNIIGSYKGVLLGFAGKLSTGCYSDTLCRGGRVIKFNQSSPENFTAEWLGALKTSKDQPPIYSNGKSAY